MYFVVFKMRVTTVIDLLLLVLCTCTIPVHVHVHVRDMTNYLTCNNDKREDCRLYFPFYKLCLYSLCKMYRILIEVNRYPSRWPQLQALCCWVLAINTQEEE